jgi:hypothetical protein
VVAYVGRKEVTGGGGDWRKLLNYELRNLHEIVFFVQ